MEVWLGILGLAVAAGAVAWAGIAGRRASQESASLRSQLDAARDALGLSRTESAQLAERLAAAKREHDAALESRDDLHRTELEAERKALAAARDEHERRSREFDERVRATFGALAAEALQRSSSEFLKLASQKFDASAAVVQADMDKRRAAVDELVRPIAETLRKTDEKLAAMERDRISAGARIENEVRQVAAASTELRTETGKLVRALSRPEVRGRYGEVQLRRIAELAGMKPYCDFAEQLAQRDDTGRLLRPDMVVRLPNGRVLAVDAKTNTDAYLQAVEATDDATRQECLERFARHVADQVAALGRKGYWKDLDGSPDFVVMFMPGDQLFDAAVSRRPDLIEKAAEAGVIFTTPSTLIALLRAMAVCWREQRMADEVHEVMDLCRQFHERCAVALEHAGGLGRSLSASVEWYNKFARSIESRLLPVLRRLEDAQLSGAKIATDLPLIETRPVDGLALGTAALPAAQHITLPEDPVLPAS